jgi:exonuclease III
MKLMSLNLWGGKEGQKLFNYLQEESITTDIFCFQEVFHSSEAENFPVLEDGTHPRLFPELTGLLKGFTGYFALTSKNHGLIKAKFSVDHGLAVFVKNSFEVLEQTKTMVFGREDDVVKADFSNLPCAIFCVKIATGKGILSVLDYHGIAIPGDKLDTPARIEASKKIAELLLAVPGAKILCGDFNLMPQAQSIQLVEQAAMKNLIKEFNISNTRNENSWKTYNNKQSFADFTFVSEQVKIKSFQVPYNLVSDHLPMILEFEIA